MRPARGTTRQGAGYLEVLRAWPDFRRLFAARTISLLGDWFSLIAIVALLRETVGSDPRALGGVLILRLLPYFLAGPVAGVVADRVSRKLVMVASDIVRAVLILGMIAAPVMPRPVAFIYTLTALQIAGSAFFEPARSAALPQLVPERLLPAANALGAIAWSSMFALGAALGGVVADIFGWRAALVIDATTYLVSARLVSRIVLPRREKKRRAVDWLTLTGARDFLEGIRFIAARPAVATVIFIKSGWGLAGAATLFLTLFGERVYAIAGRPDLGVALLLTARAVGTAIGPLLARRLVVDETPTAMRRLLGVAFVWPTVWYLLFSWVDQPYVAAGCVVLAHFGGSVLWVYSTVLLQRMVPEAYLGRVMSTDLGLTTLTISASTWLYGLLAGLPDADLRTLLRAMAVSVLVPAAVWILAAGRWPPGERASTPE
jgi:predicted MFS family arabinose efflux permease